MNAALLSPGTAAAAPAPSSIVADVPAVGREPEGCLPVSAVRQAEDELDDAIRELATKSALAADAGNTATAIEYSRRMLAAIASRTPQHKDRLAREHLAMVERSLDEGLDYFQTRGRIDREAVGGR